MVLLEPFSKLSFWSFNHPLGGSLHWIQFFNILVELQALKLTIILTVLIPHADVFFILSIPHPKFFELPLSTGPFQHSVLSFSTCTLTMKFLPQSMASEDAAPLFVLLCVCGSSEICAVGFGGGYLAMWICSLLSYLAVLHCLPSSGLISNDFRFFSAHLHHKEQPLPSPQ